MCLCLIVIDDLVALLRHKDNAIIIPKNSFAADLK